MALEGIDFWPGWIRSFGFAISICLCIIILDAEIGILTPVNKKVCLMPDSEYKETKECIFSKALAWKHPQQHIQIDFFQELNDASIFSIKINFIQLQQFLKIIS